MFKIKTTYENIINYYSYKINNFQRNALILIQK